MWKQITTWLRARWPWVAAVLAGLLTLVGLTRRRQTAQPAPPQVLGGLTPEQADAKRDRAKSARDAEVDAACRDFQGRISEIAAARERKKRGGP